MIKYDSNMMLEYCPKLGDMVQKNIQAHSQEYEEMNLTYSPFVKKTIQLFNLPANSTFQTLSSLFDTLIVDKFMGKPLPNGYSQADLDNLNHIFNWFNNVKYSGNVSKVISSRKYAKILS